MLSINPDAANRDDVARLAAELMSCRHELHRLRDVVGHGDAEIISNLLDDREVEELPK
jgi:hypothetical protein